MITIQGSYAGINTIRNISLIHRSINRTMRRLDRGEFVNPEEESAREPSVDISLSRRMRTQIGSVTQQIKDLETNLQRNNAAESALSDLTLAAHDLKEVIDQAVANPDAPPDENRGYQDRANELVSAYNKILSDATFEGEKLLFKKEATVFPVPELPQFEEFDSPEAVSDALSTVETTLRELKEYKFDLTNRSRSEYESAISKLQVASQNLAAADAGVGDPISAITTAREATIMIQRNVGLAAVAQGHLTSESVFQLLHA